MALRQAQSERLQLVPQTAHPAIGHRRHDDTRVLALGAKMSRKIAPPLVVVDEPVSRLDQQRPQRAVARADQARVGRRAPLDMLRGLRPQKRASCLPEWKRSKRPIAPRR